jgi:hypothetical protein
MASWLRSAASASASAHDATTEAIVAGDRPATSMSGYVDV